MLDTFVAYKDVLWGFLIALGVGFFFASVGYAVACDWL